MQEKMIELNSKLFKKFYSFLKHPLVTLGLGILFSVVITLINTNKREPSYYFSEPYLVADNSDLKKNLKISWKDSLVPNVHSIDFTFWNNGSKYIDRQDFIDSNNFSIYNSGKIEILTVVQTSISRPQINFNSYIQDSLSSIINISLINGETLEKNDGLTYHIVYAEYSPGAWKVNGRIKGDLKGFENKDLAFNKKGSIKQTILVLWSIFFFLLLSRIIVLALVKKPIVFRSWELLFFTVFLVCTSFMTYEYYYLNINLDWYK
jgi:hypothetical protein